jgi:hypothetical protein
MLLPNPPCGPCLTIVTNSREDKSDKLDGHDDTLIHESHILLLNSPSFTIEEKDALVEKFICGLHLPLGQNSCCNHDIKIVILATILKQKCMLVIPINYEYYHHHP